MKRMREYRTFDSSLEDAKPQHDIQTHTDWGEYVPATSPEDDEDKGDDAQGDDEGGSKAPKTVRRPWSKDEDELLKVAVARYNGAQWKKIAELVPGRSHVQCLQRWRKSLHPSVIKGRWSQKEDEMLLEVVRKNPHFKNWGFAAKAIPGRTAKQCRERYTNHLDPSIRKGGWTQEEDDFILSSHRQLGNRWSDIAAHLPGRKENAIKARFRYLRKTQSLQGQKLKPGRPPLRYVSQPQHQPTFFKRQGRSYSTSSSPPSPCYRQGQHGWDSPNEFNSIQGSNLRRALSMESRSHQYEFPPIHLSLPHQRHHPHENTHQPQRGETTSTTRTTAAAAAAVPQHACGSPQAPSMLLDSGPRDLVEYYLSPDLHHSTGLSNAEHHSLSREEETRQPYSSSSPTELGLMEHFFVGGEDNNNAEDFAFLETHAAKTLSAPIQLYPHAPVLSQCNQLETSPRPLHPPSTHTRASPLACVSNQRAHPPPHENDQVHDHENDEMQQDNGFYF